MNAGIEDSKSIHDVSLVAKLRARKKQQQNTPRNVDWPLREQFKASEVKLRDRNATMTTSLISRAIRDEHTHDFAFKH